MLRAGTKFGNLQMFWTSSETRSRQIRFLGVRENIMFWSWLAVSAWWTLYSP